MHDSFFTMTVFWTILLLTVTNKYHLHPVMIMKFLCGAKLATRTIREQKVKSPTGDRAHTSTPATGYVHISLVVHFALDRHVNGDPIAIINTSLQ